MRDMRGIKNHVLTILTDYPETRGNDALLYVMVCKRLTNIEGLTLERAMLDRTNVGLPKYASVSRARRLAQQYNKDLRPNKSVTDLRYENYKAVKEYVGSEG